MMDFITTVKYRGGEKMVEKLKKTPVVTVSVLAGVVAFQFGEATGLLKAGMSQVFGEKRSNKRCGRLHNRPQRHTQGRQRS